VSEGALWLADLYGVVVRRVAGKEPQLASSPFDEVPNPFALVHREVVHEHDLTWLQARGQDLPHVEPKRLRVR
jgi:hypothetical protein